MAEPREHLVRCGNCRRCARLVGRDQAVKARRGCPARRRSDGNRDQHDRHRRGCPARRRSDGNRDQHDGHLEAAPPAAEATATETGKTATVEAAPPRRRRFLGGVIVLGFFGLLLALVLSLAVRVPIFAGVGDRSVHPMQVAALHDKYELGIGNFDVDLSDLNFPLGETHVKTSLGSVTCGSAFREGSPSTSTVRRAAARSSSSATPTTASWSTRMSASRAPGRTACSSSTPRSASAGSR